MARQLDERATPVDLAVADRGHGGPRHPGHGLVRLSSCGGRSRRGSAGTPTTVSSGSTLPRLRVGDVAVSRPARSTGPPSAPSCSSTTRIIRARCGCTGWSAYDDQGRLITRGRRQCRRRLHSGRTGPPYAGSAPSASPGWPRPSSGCATGKWLKGRPDRAGPGRRRTVASQGRRFGFEDLPRLIRRRPTPPSLLEHCREGLSKTGAPSSTAHARRPRFVAFQALSP